MDQAFWNLLMERTGFPQEARREVARCGALLEASGQAPALDQAVACFYKEGLHMEAPAPQVEAIAQQAGVPAYTVWMLFLMEAAKPARQGYLAKGVPEQVVWDTFADLKYKALECKAVHGVWGNFVAFWYPIFYSCHIVKLGRLEFESTRYQGEEPYRKGAFTLLPGDPVKSVHIPSSGEPFTREARLDSYRRAYEFFKGELGGRPLVCVCESWLLFAGNRQILPPSSNILDFQRDWDLLKSRETDVFHDAWRVFGADYQKPVEELPEATSMQRGFKRWLAEGRKTGFGFGVLVFDGEHILNQ